MFPTHAGKRALTGKDKDDEKETARRAGLSVAAPDTTADPTSISVEEADWLFDRNYAPTTAAWVEHVIAVLGRTAPHESGHHWERVSLADGRSARRRIEPLSHAFVDVLNRLRIGRSAHLTSDAFHPEDTERHQQWMDRFQALACDPRLDLRRWDGLPRLLHDHDTIRPREHEWCVETVRRWNDLIARTRDGVASEMPEYDAPIRELRAVVALDRLAPIRSILRAYDEHRENHGRRSVPPFDCRHARTSQRWSARGLSPSNLHVARGRCMVTGAR